MSFESRKSNSWANYNLQLTTANYNCKVITATELPENIPSDCAFSGFAFLSFSLVICLRLSIITKTEPPLALVQGEWM